MKCTECGSELEIGHIFCGKCGTASPQLPAEFEALERSYLELRESYQKGEIEEGDFLSRLEEMVIEDENGNYWMLGVESGEWHRYDGQQWVREDPGIRKKEEPGEVITSAPTDVPSKTEKADRKTQNKYIIIAVGALITICILGFAVVVLVGISNWSAPAIAADIFSLRIAGSPTATKKPEPTSTPRPTATKKILPTSIPRPTAISEPIDLPLLYYEDFTDSSDDWWTGEDPIHKYSFFDGEYRIEMLKDTGSNWAILDIKESDVVIEVDVKNLGVDNNETGAIMGVICRFVDDYNFYVLEIDSNGYYGIWKMSHNIWISLVEGKKTEAVNTGKSSNHIKAVCAGTNLSLFVNDVFLTNVVDDDFSSGEVGVFAGSFDDPGVDILFDNFAVYNANP